VERGPAPADRIEQSLERRYQVFVGGYRDQHRIVEPAHQRVVAAAAEVRALPGEAGPRRSQDRGLARPHDFGIGGLRVDLVQPVAGATKQIQQPAPGSALASGRGAALANPCGTTALADKSRVGFVERHVARNPHAAVGEFVDEQFGDVLGRPVDERTEQRIREPAQRGIGGHTAHVHVHSVRREPRGGALRRSSAEITAIGRAARYRVAPAMGLERELGGREHVPDHVRPAELHVGAIASAHRQRKHVLCMIQHLLTALELPGEPVPRRVAGRPQLAHLALDRLARGKQLQLAAGHVGVVAERAAAAEQSAGDQHQQRPSQAWAPDREQPPGNPP